MSQVVFEVLSPGNTLREMAKKQQFYDRHGVEEYYVYDPDRHGVEEYYVYDPDRNDLYGLQQVDRTMTVIDAIVDWVSPRLGIRFVLMADDWVVYYPDGRRFLTTVELAQRLEQERSRAEQAESKLEEADAKAQRLMEQLRSLGVEPE